MEFVSAIFQNLFVDTTITTNFLKSHICNTFKGMDDGYWKIFSVTNGQKLFTQN